VESIRVFVADWARGLESAAEGAGVAPRD
jgi:hypothetical protein